MGRVVRFTKRACRFLKRKGVRGIIDKINEEEMEPPKIETIEFYRYIMDRTEIPFVPADYETHKGDETYLLNWVIPEMGVGSGGHTTIFRFVSNLENMGFHSRIYLHKSPNFKDNESLKEFLRKHFPILDERVETYYDVSLATYAHATIATSWSTAYFVRNFNNTISKFYFVQDFEPYFYAHGSEYEFAENTYKMGFRGITAGDWLRDKLREEYGMETGSFHFSYEKKFYYPRERKDSVQRVFFYARPVTPRRDFELGLLALDELCRRMPEVEVIFAGWDISNYNIPFKHQNKGILDMNGLAECYAQSDLCLVISNTNLSLVPLEVMACNSVAVCSKGANSSWMVTEENSVLVDYDPNEIADTLEYYLNHEEEMEKYRKKGLDYVKDTSWLKEAEKVRDMLLNWIREDEAKRIESGN